MWDGRGNECLWPSLPGGLCSCWSFSWGRSSLLWACRCTRSSSSQALITVSITGHHQLKSNDGDAFNSHLMLLFHHKDCHGEGVPYLSACFITTNIPVPSCFLLHKLDYGPLTSQGLSKWHSDQALELIGCHPHYIWARWCGAGTSHMATGSQGLRVRRKAKRAEKNISGWKPRGEVWGL